MAGRQDLSSEQLAPLSAATVRVVGHVRSQIRLVGFWENAVAQNELRSLIVRCLDERDVLPLERLPLVADRLVELAKANHTRLAR